MRLTSIFGRKERRHELRRAFGTQLRSGYALPASRQTRGDPLQTKPGRAPLIFHGKLFRQPEPAQKRGVTAAIKRRSAVEPVIGHAKSDHRMDRNYLAGYNFKRLLA